MERSTFEEIKDDVEAFYNSGLERDYVGFVVSNTHEVKEEVVEDIWLWYDLQDETGMPEDYENTSPDPDELYQQIQQSTTHTGLIDKFREVYNTLYEKT